MNKKNLGKPGCVVAAGAWFPFFNLVVVYRQQAGGNICGVIRCINSSLLNYSATLLVPLS